jgi:Cu/Ag efflux pump CusA
VRFGPELVIQGAEERLAPILMTVLTTGLALIPLIMTGNVPGQEIEYPMAFDIVGELATSTLLNLFVLPIIYGRFATPTASSRHHLRPINAVDMIHRADEEPIAGDRC